MSEDVLKKLLQDHHSELHKEEKESNNGTPTGSATSSGVMIARIKLENALEEAGIAFPRTYEPNEGND